MKRLFDISFALILSCILFIPFIIIILLIKLDSSNSVFYISKRVGKNKKIFKMIKFRTMQVDVPQIHTNDLVDPKKYITKAGKILRKYSLDEIPQIFNIIRGDMSFVGPRPALENQDLLINMREKNGINTLKPGLTGLAQVNGRDFLTLEEKVKFDNQYKINQSFIFDTKILIKTIKIVFESRGIKH